MNTTSKVRVGFAIGLVLALGVVALSVRATERLLDTNRLVARANGALARLEGATEAINNLERSRLAWVTAGTAMHNLRMKRHREPACWTCHGADTRPLEAERFRGTHLAMIADLRGHIEELRALVAPEPAQQQRFQLLESLVRRKADAATEEIPDPGKESAIGSPETLEADAQLTAGIRNTLAAMRQTEGELLARQLREKSGDARDEIVAIGMLGLLTVCTGMVAYIMIGRDLGRREALERNLLESLHNKDALLHEVHHRVKNNLQVICSLLSLQTRGVGDAGTRNVLREAEARVRSMALVHDKLHHTRDLLNIDFGDYVRTLSAQLLESYSRGDHRVLVKTNGSAVYLDLDRAVLCGMIVNELVTNALRHAFPERSEGEVEVSLEPAGVQLALAVRDNGVGMPENGPPGTTGTLGLNLVRMLTKQLKGTMEMRPGKGTEVVILFPQAA